MKSLVLFLALGAAAQAAPYAFNFTGSVDRAAGAVPFLLGDTFTASITIDSTLPDAAPGDPALGKYLHAGTSSLIQFSSGSSFSDLPFEYVVGNNYHLSSPGLETDYDSVSFYFYQPTFTLGFELRFALDAFDNDFALAPTLDALVPTGNAELPVPTDWFYRGSNFRNNGGGLIDAINASPASVPEVPRTTGLLAASLALLVLAHRISARRKLGVSGE